MNSDYFDLKALQNSVGYQKLQALWAHEYVKLMEGIQRAGSRGTESAWRFYAGQLKGADLMTQQLERAIMQMEKEGEAEASSTGKSADEILKELRGERE
jgi:hypothetical protein